MKPKNFDFKTESICSMEDFDKVSKFFETTPDHEQWIFRGHRKSSYNFDTTLERAIYRMGLDPAIANEADKEARKNELLRDGLGGRSLSKIEGGLLRRFKRQRHLYVGNLPVDENIMEWLALMQHHGAPTRLLDWTYSFFVATYFAIEGDESECAVWALDSNWVTESVHSKYEDVSKRIDNKWGGDDPNVQKKESFKLAFQSGKKLVIPVNAYRLNERSTFQQGLFLCPGDIKVCFEDNLANLAPRAEFKDHFAKFIIKMNGGLRTALTRRLHRMNLSRTTLFPGLDGFSQSLGNLVAFPGMLLPDPDWPV